MLKKLFAKKSNKISVLSPVNGDLIPIERVNDPTFANKVMGDGVAVIPAGDLVVSPCDAKVIMISETKHAIGLELSNSVQVIIHIGIDTVDLKGEGFEVLCQEGEVNSGDPLVTFDRTSLEEAGVDTTVLMIFIAHDDFELVDILKEGTVIAGESIVSQLAEKKV